MESAGEDVPDEVAKALAPTVAFGMVFELSKAGLNKLRRSIHLDVNDRDDVLSARVNRDHDGKYLSMQWSQEVEEETLDESTESEETEVDFWSWWDSAEARRLRAENGIENISATAFLETMGLMDMQFAHEGGLDWLFGGNGEQDETEDAWVDTDGDSCSETDSE